MAYYPFNGGEGGLETDEPFKDLIKLLKDKMRAAGHMLTFREAKNDPTMIDPNEYAKYYGGSYTEVAIEAWSDVEAELFGEEEDNDMDDAKRKATNNNNEQQESGKTGKGKGYTPETIRECLRTFYMKHGHFPTQVETYSSDEIPSYVTILKIAGKKTEWMKFVFGDKGPPAQLQEEEAKPPDAAPDVAHSSIPDSTSDSALEAVANETPVEIEVEEVEPVQTETEGNNMTPVDVVVEHNGDQPVNIKLEINLPDRKHPVVVRLSF